MCEFEIWRATLEDLDVLVRWRMEVLREVFSLPPQTDITDLERANREYYQNELDNGGHIACFALQNGTIVGCGGICLYREMPSPVIPTGLQRTYPNLMTQEGVRGQEWDAWCPEGGNPPSHTVTLPFTRLLAGPVDFTPGTFCFENPVFPKARVLTTLAKQLALFVILYSPLQMASDQIENYEANPGPLAFLSECPTDWERTLYPEAEIGRYITVARHAKDSDTWYLASATGEEARTSTVPLTFLTPGAEYLATIYRDGPDADYLTNPTPVTIEQRRLTAADTLTLPLARSGGYAVRLTRI